MRNLCKIQLPLGLCLVMIFAFSSNAQPDLPPNQYFDFWLGEWAATWKDPDGKQGGGTNKISRILSDKVVYEEFEGLVGQNAGFIGKSYSVYNPTTQQWHQTWVDNQGGYLDFIGQFEGDKRMFVRTALLPNGSRVKQRMVFRDITKDAFTWDWESSSDDGATWTLNWQIQYVRTAVTPAK